MQSVSWCNQQTLQNTAWDDVRGLVSPPVRDALEKVLSSLDGTVLSREECLLLANSTGDDLFGLTVAANEIRLRLVGDVDQLCRDSQHQLHQRLFRWLQVLRVQRRPA